MTDTPLQVVIPMAGLGTRFVDAGYTVPKPLLPVHGQPMFALVLANLLTDRVGSVTIVAQRAWDIGEEVRRIDRAQPCPVRIIEIDHVTGGPADTVELTRGVLDPDLPVVTGNSDQYVDADLSAFYEDLLRPGVAGTILTMLDDHPKWSYAATDEAGDVTLVREKEVISPHATVGIYGFRSAALMFEAFDAMRAARDTVNGEYYVAPAYNRLIERGRRVTSSSLGPVSDVMHGLGTPTDYEAFLLSPAAIRAADAARRLIDADLGA